MKHRIVTSDVKDCCPVNSIKLVKRKSGNVVVSIGPATGKVELGSYKLRLLLDWVQAAASEMAAEREAKRKANFKCLIKHK